MICKKNKKGECQYKKGSNGRNNQAREEAIRKSDACANIG
jgi:hypothetical protein